MDSKRLIAGILIFFILIMSVIVLINKDVLFKSKISIVYPDGCTEYYEGTKLINDECTVGRALAEEEKNRGLQWININNTNLTI